MRSPFWTVLAAVAATASIAACAGDPGSTGPSHVAADPTVTIPPDVKLLAPPSGEPEDLPGVDVSELSARERKAYWKWVSQLYAPCPDIAVSVADCVAQSRPCAACVPAAQFLARRARSGASQNEAIAAFNVRFGRDIKKIDLGDSPATGPTNAPVTLVIWSDFECPACGYAVPLIEEMLTKFPADVRLVHKLYPLKVHPHSRAAARASIAARRQGKYWEMERQLFSHQKHLEDGDLEEYARNIGLDMKRFQRDIADPKAEDIIERDRTEADKQGLTGTPFIVINGREFDLSFFKIDRDFEPWILSEIAMARGGAGAGTSGGTASTAAPSAAPSSVPTAAPSSSPSSAPSAAPSSSPASAPTAAPASAPSAAPAASPVSAPKPSRMRVEF